MKDEGLEHAHSTPIKTPKQLVTVIALAFVVPVIGIIMLSQLVTGEKRLDERTLDPEAIAARIQPVARVEFGDAPGGAAGGPKSGEEVYKSACAACHGAGVAGAHKFGDKAAWAPHLKEGLAALSKNAINGIRGMPARGGNPNLSDLEVTRAVAYMANAAGASFKEPDAPKAEAKPAQAAAPAAAPAPAPVVTAAAPAAAAPAAAAPAAAAAAGGDLLQKSGCIACHANDKKLVGPSYKDIAAKYAGDKEALDKLAKKVKAGGAGVWGQIAMPPHGHVADADIQAMVKYVLALK
jgi:cytochrome c5